MAGVSENYSKFEFRAVARSLQAGVSHSEFHCRLVSVYGENAFSRKEVSVGFNKFKYGRTALNDNPEKKRSRPTTSHTNEDCHCRRLTTVYQEKNLKTNTNYSKAIVQYFLSLGKEHYLEGMLQLVRGWANYLNADGDYMEK
jgi:hypothetical protein